MQVSVIIPCFNEKHTIVEIIEKVENANVLLKEIIIVDDLNLDFGISRLRKSGSDGGHNGLKDIANSINSTKFTRLRFGIGNN